MICAGGVRTAGALPERAVRRPRALPLHLRRAAEPPHLRGRRRAAGALHVRAVRPHAAGRHAVRFAAAMCEVVKAMHEFQPSCHLVLLFIMAIQHWCCNTGSEQAFLL